MLVAISNTLFRNTTIFRLKSQSLTPQPKKAYKILSMRQPKCRVAKYGSTYSICLFAYTFSQPADTFLSSHILFPAYVFSVFVELSLFGGPTMNFPQPYCSVILIWTPVFAYSLFSCKHSVITSLDVGPSFLCPYKDISCNIFPELMNVWVEYTVAVVSPFWSHIVFTSFLQLVVGVVRRLRRLLLLLLLVLLCWWCTIKAS